MSKRLKIIVSVSIAAVLLIAGSTATVMAQEEQTQDQPVEVEILKDSRLIVWSPEQSRNLYSIGYYGKPLGIQKPKEDFDAPLILDPIEGIYLFLFRKVPPGDA